MVNVIWLRLTLLNTNGDTTKDDPKNAVPVGTTPSGAQLLGVLKLFAD